MTRSPYRQLYRVVDASEVGGLAKSMDAFTLVIGAIERPFVVEEGLGRLMFGRQAIGLDWADVRTIAGGRLCLAYVVSRASNTVARLIACRDDLIARGFGDGFVLIEMFSTADKEQWDLKSHLDLLEAVLPYPDRNIADTILLGSSSASAIVLIGYSGPATPRAPAFGSPKAEYPVTVSESSRGRSGMSLVMRNPWIGTRFGGLRIVGESHYSDDNDPDLTKDVVGEVVKGTSSHAFFTRLEKVVSGSATYGRGGDSFWQTVAFANFCPGVVAGPRQRPSIEMWEAGHRFLPDLITAVRPRRMLVLGNETWDNFPSITDVRSLTDPKGRNRDLARLTAKTGAAADGVPITSIQHPASFGFSAKAWHLFYASFVDTMPEKAA